MINKVEFQNMKFLSHGIIEENPKKELNRVPHSWRPINSNDPELRENIRDIMWAKAEEYRIENDDNGISDYNIIEKCCRIPNDIMKKVIDYIENYDGEYANIVYTDEILNELVIEDIGLSQSLKS